MQRKFDTYSDAAESVVQVALDDQMREVRPGVNYDEDAIALLVANIQFRVVSRVPEAMDTAVREAIGSALLERFEKIDKPTYVLR